MENEIESAAEMLNLSNASFHVATNRRDGDLADGTGCSEKPERPFQVAKFDLSLVKGEVLAVCGPVAAGKVKAERVLPPATMYCCLTFSRICLYSLSVHFNQWDYWRGSWVFTKHCLHEWKSCVRPPNTVHIE